MNNNDTLRKIRYIFDYSDGQIVRLFSQGNLDVSRDIVQQWLARDEHEMFKEMTDRKLAHFLNGFIIEHRGKKDDKEPIAELELNNNMIMRKIKIALNLKVEEMVDIYKLADFEVSKHEINAIFRKPTQNQYRVCQNQFLRNFLMGLQLKHRPVTE